MRRAASRAACTAGNNSATSTPIIAITTNSSTNVNAANRRRLRDNIGPSACGVTGRSLIATPAPALAKSQMADRADSAQVGGFITDSLSLLAGPIAHKQKRDNMPYFWAAAVLR